MPLFSTVTNIVDIFEKYAFRRGCCSPRFINENRYFAHIRDKNLLRCIILLVPILGNIVVGIYDAVQHRKAKFQQQLTERFTRSNQNFQAKMLGLDVNQLPHSLSEREQIIEHRRKEELQKNVQQMIQALDNQISELAQVLETFRKIINNPQEPLKMSVRKFNGTHQKKISLYWSSLKLMLVIQEFSSTTCVKLGLDKDPSIISKLEAISKITNEIIELRRLTYREYIKILGKEELLQEAKNYYIDSFTPNEQEKIKTSIDPLNLDALLIKLRERVPALKSKHHAVEIEALIAQISNP